MKIVLTTIMLLMLSNISYATMLAVECGESVYFDEEEEYDIVKNPEFILSSSDMSSKDFVDWVLINGTKTEVLANLKEIGDGRYIDGYEITVKGSNSSKTLYKFDVKKCDNEGRASLNVKIFEKSKQSSSKDYQCTCMAS